MCTGVALAGAPSAPDTDAVDEGVGRGEKRVGRLIAERAREQGVKTRMREKYGTNGQEKWRKGGCTGERVN